MRVVCTICTDPVTEDFAATPCGHTFHHTCLSQWLAHRKTCPQCREKCLIRNVIKLFIDTNELSQYSLEDVTPQEMKDKLSLQDIQIKHKEMALTEAKESLTEAKESLEEVRADMQNWKTQYNSTFKKLKNEQAAYSSLKKQLTILQHDCDHAKLVEKQAEKLRHKLHTMEGLETLLRGTKNETDVLLKNYTSSSQLATFTVAMKRDYDALKEKKIVLQKEKDKISQDVHFLQKQLRRKEAELKDAHDSLLAIESDLQHSEQENTNLRQKVEMLESAIESPSSRAALKRILESPMPIKDKKHSHLLTDPGASPLLASHTKAIVENDKNTSTSPVKSTVHVVDEMKSEVGFKRPRNDCRGGVLFPVNKMFKAVQSSEHIASGFNGMGGQSKFPMPKTKMPKLGTHAPSKKLKFAPRLLAKSKVPNSSHKQLSISKLSIGHK